MIMSAPTIARLSGSVTAPSRAAMPDPDWVAAERRRGEERE
jgi:hypothetical protein